MRYFYRFILTSKSVRKVSLTKSAVGTTIDAKDWPMDGAKDGTCVQNQKRTRTGNTLAIDRSKPRISKEDEERWNIGTAAQKPTGS